MCGNYRPTSAELLESMSGVSADHLGLWKEEVWQDYAAPVIRAGEHGEREVILGTYGMIPKRKAPPGIRLSTMNARVETIAEKRSYSKRWRLAQTCLLPTQWFYEPNWESGKAQRWAIGMADDEPFCVAGLWKAWEEEQGAFSFSFTQLTINADDHPVMRHFHKPGDEKRSLVIVPRAEWDSWLNAGDPEIARSMLTPYPAVLMKAWPAATDYGGKQGISGRSLLRET